MARVSPFWMTLKFAIWSAFSKLICVIVGAGVLKATSLQPLAVMRERRSATELDAEKHREREQQCDRGQSVRERENDQHTA